MTRKTFILLLLFLVPALAACAGTSAADGPAPGAESQTVEITGNQVYSPQGTWLGEVARVLLDRETGKVDYVVLYYREPRVYGRAVMVTDPRRYVPIPWARFAPHARQDAVTLNADEMTLIPAPYLHRLPDSLQVDEAQAIDDYWHSVDS